VDAHGTIALLDGDKILSLLAEYIAKLLKEANISASLGIVQVGFTWQTLSCLATLCYLC
jgi:hypothetical protein